MSILSSSSMSGDKVVNRNGEDLGEIRDLMIDLESGQVVYVVLEFGGFLGMGSKLFAVPLSPDHQFIFDQSKEKLENAPGFDKNNWPDFSDRMWGTDIHAYYGVSPYWD